MNSVAIIQARTGSTRLPNKILMKINGVSIIESLLNQLSYSKYLTQKIIATTIQPSDNNLIKLLDSVNATYFRGKELDVLDRYYQCAKQFGIKQIVRISGDAPFIDPQIVDKIIEFFNNSNFDYVNNFNDENRYPVGAEVEVFSFQTLETAWINSKKPSEREHVTPYIYTNPTLFKIGHLEYTEDLSKFHWTVDRSEDLEFVKAIYKKIKNKPILLENILELLKKEPNLLDINKNVDSHEGFKKSLKEDKNHI